MLYEVNPHGKKGKHIGQPVARINTPIQDLIDLPVARWRLDNYLSITYSGNVV